MSRERGARVFVGRLSHRAGERDVERFFKGYGRIREVNMKNGFAFIEFDDYRDADDAVHDLNNKDLLGDRVTVEHARPTKPSGYRSGGGGGGGGGGRRSWGSGGSHGSSSSGFTFREKYGAPYNTEWRVLVENLSTRAGWQDLKDYMRQAGDVTFSQCHKDRAGEGVVEFCCEDDMKRAIRKLDGTELMGKRIRLSETTRGSGGRRRSRSRSPRRLSRSPRRSPSRSPRRSRSPRSVSRSPRRASRSPSPNRSSPPPQRSPNHSPSPSQNRDGSSGPAARPALD